MNYMETAQKMEGVKTLETIQEQLNVKRARAVYLIYKLRKRGFVNTKRGSKGKRIYYISPTYAVGGTSYLDIINKYAPLATKVITRDVHKIHGREITLEEALVYALQSGSIRIIIASLALYRRINWHALYKLAKGDDILRETAALYDVARTILRKLQKMPKRFRNLALPKKGEIFRYIVKPISSDDFKNIEKRWRIYIPLNHADLTEYRR